MYEMPLIYVFVVGVSDFCIEVSGNGILSLAFGPEINKHCASIILSHYLLYLLFHLLFFIFLVWLDISQMSQLVLRKLCWM